jgi:hypothetical protein
MTGKANADGVIIRPDVMNTAIAAMRDDRYDPPGCIVIPVHFVKVIPPAPTAAKRSEMKRNLTAMPKFYLKALARAKIKGSSKR